MAADTLTDTGIVEAALDIGRDLCASAQWGVDGCSWTSTIALGDDGDRLLLGSGDIGPSLYDGTAGIATALAACAQARPEGDFATTALGAVSSALAAADGMVAEGRLGLFDGATGVAWGAALVGRALDDRSVRNRARDLAAKIVARVTSAPLSGEIDLLGGVAGTLLGLAGCAEVLKDSAPDLRSVGDAVAGAALRQPWGGAWTTGAATPGGPPLLGMGHGAAGIALALAETGGASAQIACAEALEYERSWFEPEPAGWPDLRGFTDGSQAVHTMAAWCHGAIGIGLSRARLTALLPDPRLLLEVTASLEAARNLAVRVGTELHGGSVSDCTACHGLAGVVELMLVAARALALDAHAQAARRVARLMVEQLTANGQWPCGLPGGGAVPALMTGTAGIALTLLRAVGATDLPTPLLPGPSGW